MRNRWLMLVVLLAAACAPAAPSDPGPAPAPGPPPGAGPSGGVSGGPQVGVPPGGFERVDNAQVGRAYLVGNDDYGPASGNLPFGVILLRRGDEARNRALCNSFVNNISTTEEIRAADPSINIIATYWLLTRALSDAQLRDCDALLANYNYGRAQRVLAGYGKAGAPGPVFLALQLNRNLGIPANVFLLDLSRETPESVAMTTINWFDIVVDRSDDAAAGQVPSPAAAEQGRGGGFFRRLLRLAGAISCDVLAGAPDAANVAYTGTPYFDPALNYVRGTLRTVVHGNVMVSVGAQLLSDLLCPGRSSTARTEAPARETEAPAPDAAAPDRRDAEAVFAAAMAVLERDGEAAAFLPMRNAAAAGHPRAQGIFARLCIWRPEGMECAVEEALRWARRSAEQGDPEGEWMMGRIYLAGYGVEADHADALRWFRRAAAQGLATAEQYVGYFHEQGYAVPRDVQEAVRWYRRAASGGDEEAERSLRRLGAR